ncbi:Uncharacterised protein [BD1-7 clade bacterium]|uniref:Fe2OG dioxygenase domain-containing protein n=1 Tax=BD1-7 clade bacterium TaxID=2029982 RepID=A0A5S9P2V3_9GAMM|nr:Uncharacterised protein [BD1-7 clade bacterium]CAA0122774.1 Uncharacterised protein [BD1-7 clade bacterium]
MQKQPRQNASIPPAQTDLFGGAGNDANVGTEVAEASEAQQSALAASNEHARCDVTALEGLSDYTESDQLHYYPSQFTAQADHWFSCLQANMPWRQDTLTIAGQQRLIPRLQVWMGDKGTDYQYSGIALTPELWLAPMADIKQQVEAIAGCSFNSALLNFYRDGNDSVAWHADDEAELDDTVPIASISLGQARRFSIKPKKHYLQRLASMGHNVSGRSATRRQELHHGSLLLMMPGVQKRWQHAVLKQPEITGGRINLTFRKVRTRSR